MATLQGGGGFSTTLHLRAEGGGKPMALVVTAGQRHEQTAFRPAPRQGDERAQRWFDRAASRGRNRVERLVNNLKPCRLVATRYEKRAAHYLAMVTIAAILLGL